MSSTGIFADHQMSMLSAVVPWKVAIVCHPPCCACPLLVPPRDTSQTWSIFWWTRVSMFCFGVKFFLALATENLVGIHILGFIMATTIFAFVCSIAKDFHHCYCYPKLAAHSIQCVYLVRQIIDLFWRRSKRVAACFITTRSDCWALK